MSTNEPETPEDATAPEVMEPELVEAPQDLRDVELAALSKRLADTEARLRAVSKAYTDQKNEMASFRDRVEAQERLRLQRREFEVAQNFLDPVQNLKRSVEAGIVEPGSFLDGIRMIHGQFSEAMAKLGLEPVPGVGAPFDPTMHEALAVAPVASEAQDGVVLIVHVEGFMVRGKVLQAAKVVIGKFEGAGGVGEA